MRLLQLAVDPDRILDFHPNVSIVTGLDDEHRTLLLEAVIGLARSEAVPSAGLLEAHGVLFDLDQSLLSAIVQGPGGPDPVVRPSQLPAQPSTIEARALRSREHDLALLRETVDGHAHTHDEAQEALVAATEDLDQARRALEEGTMRAHSTREHLEQFKARCADLEAERPRLVAELGDARAQMDASEAAVAARAREVAAARASLEDTEVLRSSVEAELAEVEALDSSAAESEATAARAALQEIEAEVEAERAADAERAALAAMHGDNPDSDVAGSAVERLDATDARIGELERLLSVITPVGRLEIERARARLAGAASSGMVASPEAVGLADEIDRVSADVEALGPDATRMLGEDLSLGRSRLDEAHQALLEAERAARTPTLDQALVERLEDVHARLIDAVDAADAPRSRFGTPKRTVVAIDPLRAEEQEILDEMGFASYPAYVMGYSVREVDPNLEAAVDAARAELAAAEAEWDESERLTELALTRASLLDERRVLLEDARRLLGRLTADVTPQDALRSLRVPSGSAATAATRLRDALEAVGVVVGDEEVDHDELLELADAWLSESDRVETRRHEAVSELEDLKARRPELAAAADAEVARAAQPSSVTEASVDDAEEHRLERIGRARGVLAAAEQRLADRGETVQRRQSLVGDLAAASELEQAALESVGAAEASLSAAEHEHGQLITRVAALHEELDRMDRESAGARATIDALVVGTSDPEALRERVTTAAATHAAALTAAGEAQCELEDLQSRLAVAEGEVEALRASVGSTTVSEATPVEELEWYLLARLAAQRSVSIAGSVPVLLDDALRGLAAEDIAPILDRLERMAEAVQVIVLSEDPVVAAWATSAGIERAAIVSITAA